jgi:ATP-dependent Clp protease ATP-binding subunit ClpC
MINQLDRFTNDARSALTLTQGIAIRFNHDSISPEHLLLALMYIGTGTAVQILRQLGVEPGQVVRAMELALPHGHGPVPSKLPLAPRAKQVIELAVDEARQMENSQIGTEHLLLGLLRQEEGLAVQVLIGIGLSIESIRNETVRHLQLTQKGIPRQGMGKSLGAPLSYDLTTAAEEGKLDPLIGRQAEMERMIQILSRRTKNNPILIGEPGVGKRALVKGLAQRMSDGQVPASLLNRRLLVVDVGNLLTSIVYRYIVANRLKAMLEEDASSRSIFFFDNVHQLVAAAATNLDTAKIIKMALNRGELQVIGATTPEQYRKHINTNGVREWQFQPIDVNEPSPDETIEILRGVKSRYEEHHQLLITDEALNVTAYLSARYLPERFLPEKAIDLLDEASSWVTIPKASDADALRETYRELKQVQKMKQDALRAKRIDDAAALQQREAELETKLLKMRTGGNGVDNSLKLTMEDIAKVIAQWSGVPEGQIIEEERARKA